MSACTVCTKKIHTFSEHVTTGDAQVGKNELPKALIEKIFAYVKVSTEIIYNSFKAGGGQCQLMIRQLIEWAYHLLGDSNQSKKKKRLTWRTGRKRSGPYNPVMPKKISLEG